MTYNTLQYLKTDTKARYQGYMYFFREGFCWTDVNSIYLKSRIKNNGVFDVLSMSLFTQVYIPDYYFVCMINSKLLSLYVDNFINNTSHFQINDARQLPIIIPTEEGLNNFENIFKQAIIIKKKQYSNSITLEKGNLLLSEIQGKLDELIKKLYNIV